MDSATFMTFLPFILIFALFIFSFRSQKKQAEARATMLRSIKAGDKVETISRVVGEVVSVDGNYLILNIAVSGSCKVKVHLEAVAGIFKDDEDKKSDELKVEDKSAKESK